MSKHEETTWQRINEVLSVEHYVLFRFSFSVSCLQLVFLCLNICINISVCVYNIASHLFEQTDVQVQLIGKGQPNPLKNILDENDIIFIMEKLVSSVWALCLFNSFFFNLFLIYVKN